ncbi:multiple epidermal growth factor-like domains protein 6 [Ostrea edulis]|uniref:multiple epidermal growth factor-like domains protein 6 n=1 Tax=Ostrea edulis TaxID=37623 RepID=UPI0024AEEABD|nr:multiple epidermal growth factor-like domains protein 6 [Ostrea edulis]
MIISIHGKLKDSISLIGDLDDDSLVFSPFSENIALLKPAWQEHPYDNILGVAGNAVDGEKSDLSYNGGQCTTSAADQRTATWWVNLSSVLNIHHITIFHRTENSESNFRNFFTPRFLGFYVFVSNTTNRLDGHLCFHDTNYDMSTIPSVINITCPVHGQYVIFYNERLSGTTYPYGYSFHAFNDLCEVEVYGCPVPGYYGLNCSIPCPDTNCRYCHSETGACHRCKPGYQGHQCELPCSPQYYGELCKETCGNCSEGVTCNHVNGTCTNGCDVGFYGEECRTRCPVPGYYGLNCSIPCDDTNCRYCHSETGACYRCKPGYQGHQCKLPCSPQYYGELCKETCGGCSDGMTCNHVDGTCTNGCDVGFYGEECKTRCPVPGYYGLNCSIPCDDTNCRYCHSETGACYRCKPGYQGHQCKLPCSPQYYGELCKETCGNCSDGMTCNHVDGTCTNGCDVGFYGEECKTRCPVPGYYGLNCSIPCDDTNCRYCHSETGACYRCKPGYQGHQCKLPCSPQYYGELCKETCGSCSDGMTCNHVDGTCTNGCDVGFYGEECKTRCPVPGYYGLNCSIPCDDTNCRYCHSETGACYRCKPGYQGHQCKLPCSPQYYGELCKETCGSCSDGMTCNHVDGTCTNACDVGFYGEECKTRCPVPGYYGLNCSIPCDDTNCRYCHSETGACYRCKPGYQGHQCKLPCSPQYYGELCKETCGSCSDGMTCNHVDGTCTNGCDVGFYGEECKTRCPVPGYYGLNCSIPCDDTNCRHCHSETGACYRCKPGYQGHQCKLACSPQYYGELCKETCGSCSDGMTCNHVDGTCTNACDVGFYGEECKTRCPVPGYYGLNCSIPCDDTNCRYCHSETGACYRCKPGYQGHQCKLPCSPQYYGELCKETCGSCSDGMTCNHVDGTCTNGCDVGFYGEECKTRCPVPGYYGLNCSIPCDDTNCRYCHSETGACYRCKPGYQGHQCKLPCSPQYYGELCKETCGSCSDGMTCNHVDGTCTNACDVGFYGEECKTRCPVPGYYGLNCSIPCDDTNCRYCHSETGACYRCKPGYQGHQCKLPCSPQYYGELCKETCGSCSDGMTCNHVDGTCTNGCDVGFYGEECKTRCPVPGYYGLNCSIPCDDTNCRHCHSETGACYRCKPGYQGHQCKLACSPQYYGELCKETCGSCSDGMTCNHVDGTCTNACDVGFYGEECKTRCPVPGYYGLNCSIPCDDTNCRYCHSETGACYRCKPGYQGHQCKLPCSPQYYGELCKETCGSCSDGMTCNHVDGTCTNGCDVGFYGEECKTRCPVPGYYGLNCSIPCDDTNCRYCHSETGACFRCKPGYQGHQCKLPCSPQYYGELCKETCGSCSDGMTCNHVDGTCTNGCDVGFYGEECKTHLPPNSTKVVLYPVTTDLTVPFLVMIQTVDTVTQRLEPVTDVNLDTRDISVNYVSCSPQYYGELCKETCGSCSDGMTCNHVDGTCTNGCDVGFYGEECKTRCPVPGYYGLNCSIPCDDTNCRYCHSETGACFRCKPGYQGHQCKLPCSPQYYGELCKETCGSCSDGMTCNHVDGTCTNGCDVGFYGEECKTRCPVPGYYGLNCSIPCDDTNCRYCHSETGACFRCKPGYQGHQCKLPCSPQYYGELCKETCGSCSDGMTCNHVDGTCTTGCDVGFYGEECKTRCPVPGYYGLNCSIPCDDTNCRYCHSEIGACYRCKPGYQGHQCKLPCSPQYYGDLCKETCGSCSDGMTCNHVDGTCTNGCDVGFYGEECKTRCPVPGYYGLNCFIPCDDTNCRYCHSETGACYRCKPGYQGHQCKLPCSPQYYGELCKETCGSCSDGMMCNHVDGTCTNGCDVGFYGEECKTRCPVPGYYGLNCSIPCDDTNCRYCHSETGACYRCKPGYQGHQCKLPCSPQYYGELCKETCGSCSDGMTCNHVNGTCTNGCDVGFYGEECKTHLPPNSRKVVLYPVTTDLNVPFLVMIQTVDTVTQRLELITDLGARLTSARACPHAGGPTHCIYEALAAPRSPLVRSGPERGQYPCAANVEALIESCLGLYAACSPQYYGELCKETCGSCRDGMTCNHVDGTCTNGCDVGFYGEECKTRCPVPGYYGLNCSIPCDDTNCRYCHSETGACYRCKPGYQGYQCKLPCSPQYYGELCKETCGSCRDGMTCNHVDGTCTNGCDVGFYGEECKTRCPVPGYYGLNCSIPCDDTNCRYCHSETGACYRCKPGYQGHQCKLPCSPQFYGELCKETCGSCSDVMTCNHVDGTCTNGCDVGFYGEECKTRMSLKFKMLSHFEVFNDIRNYLVKKSD